MLIIHPPSARPCEPPAGAGHLCHALRAAGAQCDVLDLNLSYLTHMALRHADPPDTPTQRDRRAVLNAARNLRALRDSRTYESADRHGKCVLELERALALATGGMAGLANFSHPGLAPLRSADLIRMAEEPELLPGCGFIEAELRSALRRRPTGQVGISLNFLSQALPAFAIAGLVRRLSPAARITLGGGLVTTWMSRPGGLPHGMFAGLINELHAGAGESRACELAGVTYNGQRGADYSWADLGAYLSPVRVLPFAASTGCYWKKCTFCPESAEGNPLVAAEAGETVQSMAHAVRAHGAGLVHLTDSAVTPAVLARMAERGGIGAPWYGFVRPTAALADPGFARALRDSGCVMLKLGIESGDQRVLDESMKGTTVESCSRVLEALHLAGIAAYVYLLFGTPAEDEAAAMRTLQFTVRHAGRIGFLNLALFNMPLGAPGAERYGRGTFTEGDLSIYTDFAHPHGWDRKRVREFLEGTFKHQPAIREIVLRSPAVFTSSHAPFFTDAMRQRG